MALDYGQDVSCYPDLDPLGTYVSGNVAICQALARRLTTPRGGLFYAPNYGTDIRAFMNEALTTDAQYRIKAAIEAECRQDERVQACNADVTVIPQTNTATIHVTGTASNGPFQFVAAVTSVNLQLLKTG